MWLTISQQENESRTKITLWKGKRTKDVTVTFLLSSIYKNKTKEKTLCDKEGGPLGKDQSKLSIWVDTNTEVRTSASLGCSDGGQSYPTLELLAPLASMPASNLLWHFMNIHNHWLSTFWISLSLSSVSTFSWTGSQVEWGCSPCTFQKYCI